MDYFPLIDKIIKYWLFNELNASKIFEKSTKNNNIKLSADQTIRNILDIIRQFITHYLYDKYLLEIGENERKKIALDESFWFIYPKNNYGYLVW